MGILNNTLPVHNNTHAGKECLVNKDWNTVKRGTAVNVAYGIIAVLAFTSNLFFCLAMSKRRKRSLKTPHDKLIFSLAIADMLTGKKTFKDLCFLFFVREMNFVLFAD